LSDGAIDRDDARVLLVEDGIDGDGRLAGLTVADDQLSLAPPHRDRGIDRLDPRLQRHLDRVAMHDRRRRAFDRQPVIGVDPVATVDRPTQRIDDAPQKRRPDRHIGDPPGPPQPVAGHQPIGAAQNDDTDPVGFQAPCKTHDPIREPHQFL